jgi:uncharacterized protein
MPLIAVADAQFRPSWLNCKGFVVSDLRVSVNQLCVYPIKSCAGVSLTDSLLIETGLEFDRAWMVVDVQGMFVTQRQLPRMALIQTTLKSLEMVLRAPGMLALHVALDTVEKPTQVQVWDDKVAAYDMGDLAAQWFSDFLGRPLRLVRFDPEQKRLSNKAWTGDIDAENAFSDGFPILVTSTASLDEMNRRLRLAGQADIALARFRPNLVLDGLDAHGEDHLDELVFGTAEGDIRLKLVKPCTRCSIPDVDPLTAAQGHAVGDVLASYRSDARMQGALTFAMNAVIVSGIDIALKVGMQGEASFRFE